MKDRYMFRGKRIDNGEWVEGYLLKPLFGKTNIMEEPEKNGELSRIEEIDENTICQCTGLRDKKGKLIYENDILSGFLDVDFPEDETRTLVLWHENGWCTKEPGCVDFEKLDDWDSEHFEVIGNVVDNPKLLEV